MSRIDEELGLLRRRFENLESRADGQWVRLPEYTIPAELWQPTVIQVAFQIPPQVATAPYAFHVHPHDDHPAPLRLLTGADILNYTHPTVTPWGTDWGTFSWQLETWTPATPLLGGTTMLDFVRSIAGRFVEGA